MEYKQPHADQELVSKEFNDDDINIGIERIKRRIDDVNNLLIQKAKHDGELVNRAEFSIRETVREVFGDKSPEYNRYGYHEIWDGGHKYIKESDSVLQKKFEAGIPKTITMLEGLIIWLEEKRIVMERDPKAQALKAFEAIPLHSVIEDACRELYKTGHYADATFAASKALVDFVKERSSRSDLDGSGLMTTVFSKNKPIIAFNDLYNKTDEDEQEGMMHLFVGGVLAVRNPRAHSFLEDSPERALEYICLLSLLAKKLDEAKMKTTP